MQWSTIQQLIRILLYTAGSVVFGDAIASGEVYQSAIGGVVAVAAFVWWIFHERKTLKGPSE